MSYAPHHRHYVAELPPKGKPMKEANTNRNFLQRFLREARNTRLLRREFTNRK